MSQIKDKYKLLKKKDPKSFHLKRRMFCIYDNKFFIAKPNLPYSHAIWFAEEGWITREDDSLMDKIVRGYIDNDGEIYFYTGYDFRVDDETEKIFFSYLSELVKELNIDKEAQIFGAPVVQGEGDQWFPSKSYGKIKHLLN